MMQNFKSLLTMSRSGLLSLLFLFGTMMSAESQYLEDVKYPVYDSNNADHVLISTNADWKKINGPAHYYYVKPGDYRSAGRIDITSKGTASARRYLVLYGNQDIHPGKLPESQQANVHIAMNGARYWTVHRISTLHYTNQINDDDVIMNFMNGASNNIIDSCNFADFYGGVVFRDGCHYNTVQRSRIVDQTLASRKADRATILMTGARWDSDAYIRGSKILDNEIRNTADGFQPTWRPGLSRNFPGTIFDGNLVWNTPDIYVTGVGSNTSDPNGMYSYSENAIDVKAASSDASAPMVITNNKMWGFRRCAVDGDGGGAVAIHYGSNHIVFEDNLMFDSEAGIGIAAGGIKNSTIKRNILFECNKSPRKVYAFIVYEGGNVKIEDNFVINTGSGYAINLESGTTGTLKRNVIINGGWVGNSTPTVSADNHLYNARGNVNSIDHSTADPKMGDFVFTYDNYTNSPKQKTLKGIVTTSASPHYGKVNSSPILSISSFSTSNVTTPVPVVDEPNVAIGEGPWIMDVYTKELR